MGSLSGGSRWTRVAWMLVLIWVVAGCGATPEGREGDPGIRGEYAYDFSSLSEMVATSSAVVEGRVTDVAPGPVVGATCSPDLAPEDCAAGGVQFTDVTVMVEDVFVGSDLVKGSTITISELPTAELPLTPIDASGFFFLHYGKSDGFRLLSPQARFLINDRGVLTESEEYPDEWVREILAGTPSEFRSEIVDAAKAVAAGKVSPAAPSA